MAATYRSLGITNKLPSKTGQIFSNSTQTGFSITAAPNGASNIFSMAFIQTLCQLHLTNKILLSLSLLTCTTRSLPFNMESTFSNTLQVPNSSQGRKLESIARMGYPQAMETHPSPPRHDGSGPDSEPSEADGADPPNPSPFMVGEQKIMIRGILSSS